MQFLQGLNRSQPIPDSAYQALFHFDSRATASLLKDLSKAGLTNRAAELFDWLRKLEAGHPLHSLCDVYTYTAMISMCIYQQAVDRAMELAQEMRERGVERNVHTYTALMNVCIKCGKCQLALETYHQMRQDSCTANVVTYNTLIDVYGKMQQWEQAVKILTLMKNEVQFWLHSPASCCCASDSYLWFVAHHMAYWHCFKAQYQHATTAAVHVIISGDSNLEVLLHAVHLLALFHSRWVQARDCN